jgi:P27 family predicted phage terminase small subunit
MPRGRKNKTPEVKTAAYTALPEPPEYLEAWGLQEWRRAGPVLIAEARLTPARLSMFGVYCQAWDTLGNALKDEAKNGAVTQNEKGSLYPNPCMQIKNQSLNTIRQLAVDFGITALAESKLPSVKAVGDALDEFKGGE